MQRNEGPDPQERPAELTLGCAAPTQQALATQCNTSTRLKLPAARGETRGKRPGPGAQVTYPVHRQLPGNHLLKISPPPFLHLQKPTTALYKKNLLLKQSTQKSLNTSESSLSIQTIKVKHKSKPHSTKILVNTRCFFPVETPLLNISNGHNEQRYFIYSSVSRTLF